MDEALNRPVASLRLNPKFGAVNVLLALGWRNLWRNPRRTWLTASGIAFSVWMLVFSWSMNNGTFGAMIDTAARQFLGHVQIQHPEYLDDPAFDHLINDVSGLVEDASNLPEVEGVAVRAQSTALLSAGERSFGGLVIGVDPQQEAVWSTMPSRIVEGRYLQGAGDLVLGVRLARNLGVGIGDEVVMLGTALKGGVAAAALAVVGILETGQAEMDRTLAQMTLDDFRAGWQLGADQAHALVLLLHRNKDTAAVAGRPWADGVIARPWTELMPEMVQMVELKRSGQGLFFVLIAVIVVFSVINTFMMIIFERTRELGMLRALGMRGGQLQTHLHIEAFWLCILGTSLGLALTGILLALLSVNGLPLPESTRELMMIYQMPERLYPEYSWGATWVAVVSMLIGTQLAVLLPAWRVRRMLPVEALRKED